MPFDCTPSCNATCACSTLLEAATITSYALGDVLLLYGMLNVSSPVELGTVTDNAPREMRSGPASEAARLQCSGDAFNNVCIRLGGAIGGANFTLENMLFTSAVDAVPLAIDVAASVQLTDVRFVDNANSFGASGVAISASGLVHVDKCLFENNTAASEAALSIQSSDDVRVTNTNFSRNLVTPNNTGVLDAGALLIYESDSVNVSTTLFYGNGAPRSPSAAPVVLRHNRQVVVSQSEFISNGGIAMGGGVGALIVTWPLDNAVILIEHCTFTSNFGKDVGALSISENNAFVQPIIVYECGFDNNVGELSGALHFARIDYDVILKDVNFNWNTLADNSSVQGAASLYVGELMPSVTLQGVVIKATAGVAPLIRLHALAKRVFFKDWVDLCPLYGYTNASIACESAMNEISHEGDFRLRPFSTLCTYNASVFEQNDCSIAHPCYCGMTPAPTAAPSQSPSLPPISTQTTTTSSSSSSSSSVSTTPAPTPQPIVAPTRGPSSTTTTEPANSLDTLLIAFIILLLLILCVGGLVCNVIFTRRFVRRRDARRRRERAPTTDTLGSSVAADASRHVADSRHSAASSRRASKRYSRRLRAPSNAPPQHSFTASPLFDGRTDGIYGAVTADLTGIAFGYESMPYETLQLEETASSYDTMLVRGGGGTEERDYENSPALDGYGKPPE